MYRYIPSFFHSHEELWCRDAHCVAVGALSTSQRVNTSAA